jgi:hypothetical protein
VLQAAGKEADRFTEFLAVMTGRDSAPPVAAVGATTEPSTPLLIEPTTTEQRALDTPPDGSTHETRGYEKVVEPAQSRESTPDDGVAQDGAVGGQRDERARGHPRTECQGQCGCCHHVAVAAGHLPQCEVPRSARAAGVQRPGSEQDRQDGSHDSGHERGVGAQRDGHEQEHAGGKGSPLGPPAAQGDTSRRGAAEDTEGVRGD